MEILTILLLIALNGIFAMSEMSMVTSKRYKLEQEKKQGKNAAGIAIDLAESPGKFLSTVQIGITLVGILLGVYSGENITEDVIAFLNKSPLIRPYSHSLAVGIVVVSITFLSIVFGELFPKRVGMIFPEKIAIMLAGPMKVLSILTSPFVWLLTTTNTTLLKILGINSVAREETSEEEIKFLVKESAESGVIENIEHSIVERVFELGDRRINSLLTHESNIVFFSTTDSCSEIIKKISTEKHSAYPVCKDNDIDEVLGIVLLKDIFGVSVTDTCDIKKYMRLPLYVNENMYAYRVLELFKEKRMHYAIVVDEYGSTVGIVTMDDLIDALVGNASEDYRDEYQIVERDPNSWFVDGQYPVMEFLKFFQIELDEDYESRFTTVAGLLIHANGVLPEVGQKFSFGNYQIEVMDRDGQRIDKVLVTKVN